MRITEEDLIKILLVRSVEEREPRFYTAAQLEEAESSAGEVAEGAKWIQRRASYLFSLLPEGMRETVALARVPPNSLLIVSLPAFVAGIASNFLGPSTSFHILYNPLIALVLWNLLVFVAFSASALATFGGSARPPRKQPERPETADNGRAAETRPAIPLRRRVCASLWMRVHQSCDRVREAKGSPLPAAEVMRGFWGRYQACCGRLASARVQVLFHAGALALVAGAIVGVYVRGVFFEYVVVWKSTFVRDPEFVRFLLNLVLAVPSYIVTGDFVTAPEVRELMSAGGSPAAQWIHVIIVAALLFAVLPRLLLLAAEAMTLRAKAPSFGADMSDDYFAGITGRAWDRKIGALREHMTSILSEESSRLSESVAAYVRDQLYDRDIVPKLAEFREQGGRIADMEAAIVASCEEFEKPLEGYIAAMQENLKASVSAQITTLMGRELSGPHFEIEHGTVHSAAAGASIVRGEDLTDTFAGVIHMTITTVITGTVAAMSGGFGKTLGIAIVSVLLHTSGPVGWLIGAIVGLLVAGGVSWAAKDKISDAVKDYAIPSFVTRKILSKERLDDKVEEGRVKIYRDVRAEVQKQLSQTVDRLKEPLLAQMIEILKSRASGTGDGTSRSQVPQDHGTPG